VFFNEVHRFNTNSRRWSLVTAQPDPQDGFPAPRAFSIAGRVGNEFIVGFGITYTADFSSIVAYNDLWGFNTNTNRWRMIRPNNDPNGPAPRAETSAVVYQGKLYLFGGSTAQFVSKSDTWVYNFATNTWTQLNLAVKPSARYGALFAVDTDNDRMVIYGGERTVFTQTGVDFVFAGPDTQWAFDFHSLTWTQITPLYSIPNRNNGNGAVWFDDKLLAFGGDIGGGTPCPNAIFEQNNVNETWVYNSETNVWVQLCPEDAPPNLKRATSILVDNTVYMFGGFAYDTATCGPFIFTNDVYTYRIRGCNGGVTCQSRLLNSHSTRMVAADDE
jgi:N-acetylneuraminic acid mutarotase